MKQLNLKEYKNTIIYMLALAKINNTEIETQKIIKSWEAFAETFLEINISEIRSNITGKEIRELRNELLLDTGDRG
jgi:hypothetical protein